MERNTRCSSSYRKYNESIPPFLHNRPRQFVDHCKDRLVSSESIQETSINRDADVYIISSHGRKYRLSFGDPETMPFCECKDWDRFQLPCKHFMAVIQSNHEASWESIPVFYRESPFFTLDESILFSSQATLQDHALELGHPEEDISVEGNVVFKDVPRRVHVPRSKAASCRELLSEIKSLSYIIYDEDVLETLHSELLSALDELREAAPQDNGLLLSHPFRVTRKPEEMFTNNQKRFKRIPVAKSRKGKFTGRVGIGAEEKRKATSYKITAVKKEQKLETIMEEPVPFEENWEEMYDLNNLPAPNPYARGWDDDVSFESTGVEAGSTQCAPSQISSGESSSSGDDVNANDDNDDEDVTITKVRTREPPTERPKHRKLKLSPTETNSILNNRMLTDESINITQNNLHKQFPEFAGFEDTVLGATQMFSVFKSFRKYIQILHTGDLHWVCTANLDDHRGRNDSASLYDSLNGGKVPHRVATQIAAFSFCQDAELKITVEPVQQQSNGVDCGVYAIAFATSLAFGEDPCKITYDEPKMRAHLLHCLKSRKMIPFPKVQSKITCLRSENRVAYVELFCSCRLPYDIEDDEDNPNKDMAECSECLSWFHRSCEQIPDWVFYKSKARRKWYCKLCDKSQS